MVYFQKAVSDIGVYMMREEFTKSIPYVGFAHKVEGLYSKSNYAHKLL